MLSLNTQQRYFLFGSVVDMRKGFDSLCGIVISGFKMDPLSGDVFIFLSRTKTKIKLLQWQGDARPCRIGRGFAIYYKRLEKGTFEHVENTTQSAALISSQQLMLIMEGIQLSSIKKRVRYHHFNVNKLQPI